METTKLFGFLNGQESHPGKLLKDHLKGVFEKSKEISNFHGYNMLVESLKYICLTHDVAKSHLKFQKYLKTKKGHYPHSEPSSYLTFMLTKDIFHAEIVRRHHSYQVNFEDIMSFWRNLNYQDVIKALEEFLDLTKIEYLTEKEWKRLIFQSWHSKYLLNKTVKAEDLWFNTRIENSIFITSDRLDALNVDRINFDKISYQQDRFDKFLESLPKNHLSDWKNEIRESTLSNVDTISEPGIYTITLPTGAGKTITGLQASMKLANKLSLKTIIYVLPFISIVDQNSEVAKNIYDKVQEDHHLVSASKEKEDLDNLERFILSFRYFKEPLIVTTLAKFWEVLYSPNANDSMSFHRLKDAVVILDEPQSIPPEYWQGFGETLSFLSKKMGTFFILMTATQPKIEEGKELAPKSSFPENRHSYHIINKKIFLSEIKQFLEERSDNSSLIILNTKKEALKTFILLREHLKNNLFFLSTWVIPKERLDRIKQIKQLENKNLPRNLISTQVVEAGVDLDFDYIFKDLSPFDSIVQAAGRCNRRMLNKLGTVTVAEIVDDESDNERSYASYVYDSISLNNTKEIFAYKNKFSENEVQELLDKYYKALSVSKYQKGPWYDIKEGNWSNYKPLIEEHLYEDVVFVDVDGTVSNKLYEIESLEHSLENYERKKQLWKEIQDYSLNVPHKELEEWETHYNEVFLEEDKKLVYKGNGVWLITQLGIGEIYSEEVGFIPYELKEDFYG